MELTIDQTLLKAVEAHKAGQLQEADRLYSAILEAQPKHPHANHNLGVLTVGVGKVNEALHFLKTALEANPSISQFWISYIDALIKLGRKSDAKAVFDQAKNNGVQGDGFDKLEQRLICLNCEPNGNSTRVQDPTQAQLQSLIKLYKKGQFQKVLKQADTLAQKFPESAILLNIRGAALKDLGKFVSSVDAYKQALAIKPDYAEAYNNMGVTLQELGELEEAIDAYEKALAIKPNYAEAYYNMGNYWREQDKLEEAIDAYRKALAIKPDYAEVYYNMGVTLQELGELEEAIDAYRKALAIKPDYAEAFNNMGVTLQELGELEEAISAYKEAIAIKPDYVDAWSNGAEAFEKWNKLTELALWLKEAFKILKPVPSDLRFYSAKLQWRYNNKQEAIELISNIDLESISKIQKQDYFNLRAKCYEASEDYDSAFVFFENMNSLAKKSNEYLRLDPESYFQSIRDQVAVLKSNSFKKPLKNTTEKPDLVPTFLVGFPRSGTTLLDTILRSHSSIDVVEEQPLVNSAKAFLEKSGYHGLGQSLPPEVITGARKAYTTELNKHIEPARNNSILIDKLPLNILQVPLIQELYPQAKFILSLRHPLDTILSCWMQNFELNSAMANMIDLDRIVEFYCIAMETFKLCRDKYKLGVHQIRYEDLLEDLSGETSALLKFLDLDWEDKMKNYQKTALKRGRINTPSYSQVVQPIYKDAKYRWLNYEKYLGKYIEQVEPWINEFGYRKC